MISLGVKASQYLISNRSYIICYLYFSMNKYVICAHVLYNWCIHDSVCIYPFLFCLHSVMSSQFQHVMVVVCSRTSCKTAFGWWFILGKYINWMNKQINTCYTAAVRCLPTCYTGVFLSVECPSSSYECWKETTSILAWWCDMTLSVEFYLKLKLPFKKIRFKIASGKWGSFYSALIVLTEWVW